MNGSIALDNLSADQWYPLAPHFNVFELTDPLEVSGNVSFPKPNVATISAFLENDPDKDSETIFFA